MMTHKTLKVLGFLGAVSLIGAFTPPQASASELILKLGHNGAPGSLFDACAKEFAKRVNANLAGKAKVEVFGAEQLGKDSAMLKKLRLGTAQIALNSSIMASKVNAIGVFDMPYIIHSREHMRRVIKQVFWPMIEPRVEKEGYKILAVWENGFRQITNNVRPIYKPADLQGIKLRTPKSKWRIRMFKAWGANPSPLSFGEVFMALKTGTFDGQENPLAQIVGGRFYEVQKYLSLTDHVYTPAYLVVDPQHWAEVPADVRKIVQDTARNMLGFVYKTGAEMDKKYLKVIKDAGVKVNVADKQAFIDASGPIYKEFAKDVSGGEQLIKAVQAAEKK